MSQLLPVGEFQWVEPTLINIDDILTTPGDANYGYNVEVDLNPEHLHDALNDYPLTPEMNDTINNMLVELYFVELYFGN